MSVSDGFTRLAGLYAIDFAYMAIDQAEYAALNAILTRTEADELSAKHATA